MIYSYQVKSVNGLEYSGSVCEIPNNFFAADDSNLDLLAEEVCEYIWRHHNGWEWLLSGTVFELFKEGTSLGYFEITVESQPTFDARRVKWQSGKCNAPRAKN